jgi:hypothetical protein
MKELNHVRKLLLEALENAQSVRRQYSEEWSAGRQRGLQDAIEIVDRVLAKAALLPL